MSAARSAADILAGGLVVHREAVGGQVVTIPRRAPNGSSIRET
jgi:hypothetical protein